MFYEEVLGELNARGVKYLVVGGVAVNLWGAERMTHDLDLVVDLSPTNLRNLVRCLARLGFQPRAPVDPGKLADPRVRSQWIRRKGMRAFSFYDPASPFRVVDILIEEKRFDRFTRTRVVRAIGPLDVPIVSLEDLIAMKREAGRAQDRADVRILARIRRLLGAKEKS